MTFKPRSNFFVTRQAAMMSFSQVPAATWHSDVSNLPVEAAWLVEGDAAMLEFQRTGTWNGWLAITWVMNQIITTLPPIIMVHWKMGVFPLVVSFHLGWFSTEQTCLKVTVNAPENSPAPPKKSSSNFQPLIFRGYVSSREGERVDHSHQPMAKTWFFQRGL